MICAVIRGGLGIGLAGLTLVTTACVGPVSCPDDWARAGYFDAMAGRGPGAIHRYGTVCAGRQPDQSRWAAGYERGRAKYCTETHAARIGEVRGDFNFGICPEKDRKRLADAHHRGNMRREMLDDMRENRWGRVLPRF